MMYYDIVLGRDLGFTPPKFRTAPSEAEPIFDMPRAYSARPRYEFRVAEIRTSSRGVWCRLELIDMDGERGSPPVRSDIWGGPIMGYEIRSVRIGSAR